MNNQKFTLGPQSGHPTQKLARPLMWVIIVILIVIGVVWLATTIRNNGGAAGKFFAPHPNDLVERTPGVFVRQGVSESTLESTEFSGTVTNFPPGTFVMVAKCNDPRKRIDCTVTTDGRKVTYWVRLDRDPGRTVKFIATSLPIPEVNDENSSELSQTEFRKGFHTAEVMVEPNQMFTRFEVVSVIGPRLNR